MGKCDPADLDTSVLGEDTYEGKEADGVGQVGGVVHHEGADVFLGELLGEGQVVLFGAGRRGIKQECPDARGFFEIFEQFAAVLVGVQRFDVGVLAIDDFSLGPLGLRASNLPA